MPRASSWIFGPFEFNATTFRLTREGQAVPLEPKAQDVLRLLLDRAPAVVEKADIFSVVWKDVAVTDNALTRIVAQLRKALDDDARSPRYIETVATRGYRFVAEVTRPGEAGPEDTPVAALPAAVHPIVREAAAPAGTPATTRLAPRSLSRIAVLGAAVVLLVLAARPALLRLATRLSAANPTAMADAGPGAAAVSVLRAAQFTTGDGVDGTPAFSFDSSAIAFTSDRSGAFEIYVQSLAAGAAPTALTSNGRQNVQPAWSPDGQFIAFHEAAGGGIWVVPSRGGTARRVVDHGSRPAWSPDGRWIAFQTLEATDLMMIASPNEGSTISLVEPRSGDVRRVTQAGPNDGPHVSPQWSADSARLYFVETPRPYMGGREGVPTTIWSVKADGSDRRREASTDRILPDVAIAPDGGRAWALSRVAPGLSWFRLGGVPSDSGLHQVSVPANGRPMQPAVSRNGRLLAWTGLTAVSSLWSVPVGNASAAEPMSLGRGLRVTGAAAAPDGRLAYSGILQGNAPQVWTRDTHGATRQVTIDEGEHLIPFWLDGYTELGYFASHGGVAGFSAVNVDTGRERLLFRLADLPSPPGTSPHPLMNLNVQPDGALSQVVMTLVRDHVPNLWVVPLHGGRPSGEARQVTFEQAGGSFPHWSPDGRGIVYQCGEGENTHVCMVGADGAGHRQLTHEAGVHFIGGWMGPDTLLVAAQREAVWNVIGLSIADGAQAAAAPVRHFTSFTDARSYVRYPQYDPAGKRILFERAQTTANIWRAALPR